MAETERDGHRVAFNLAFKACDLPWHWSVERYGELLAVTGGRERLLHDMRTRADAPKRLAQRESLASWVHQCKNGLYADLIRSHGIPLRPGVRELMAQCSTQGVAMAITTTTSQSNVDALLRAHWGAGWAEGFAAVVCGEDVARKKPDPEVYVQALDRLRLKSAEAVALEDSPAGVRSAKAAHVQVVVTRSVYFANAAFEGVMAVGSGLDQRDGWEPKPLSSAASHLIGLDDLMAWHSRTNRHWPTG